MRATRVGVLLHSMHMWHMRHTTPRHADRHVDRHLSLACGWTARSDTIGAVIHCYGGLTTRLATSLTTHLNLPFAFSYVWTAPLFPFALLFQRRSGLTTNLTTTACRDARAEYYLHRDKEGGQRACPTQLHKGQSAHPAPLKCYCFVCCFVCWWHGAGGRLRMLQRGFLCWWQSAGWTRTFWGAGMWLHLFF